ncbi:MAG: electron transport complex subunit E [Pseudomonadota bacterium]
MGLAREFTKGLWDEIPPFRFVLGLCPILAVSTAVENGLGMGLAVTFVLVGSNVLISLLRKVIPDNVRLASFIVIIATFVVVVELTMQAYFYPLYEVLGIFVPLIVVNCIPLGRAEAFASKRPVVASALDGLGMGVGYTLSLVVLSAIRELFGKGTLLGHHIFWEGFQPMEFLIAPQGAFVCLGLMLGLMNLIGTGKK